MKRESNSWLLIVKTKYRIREECDRWELTPHSQPERTITLYKRNWERLPTIAGAPNLIDYFKPRRRDPEAWLHADLSAMIVDESHRIKQRSIL